MALLEIVLYPDEGLREVCAPVPSVDDSIRQLLDNMAETMYDAPGIGLAAPQVGVSKRAIVVDVEGDQLFKMVNPEIIHTEGQVDSEEGCLSIPDIRERIKRAERIKVKGLDETGAPFELEAEGMLAICLQHEIDHLNGVLFIDYLSRLKKQLIKGKLKRLSRS